MYNYLTVPCLEICKNGTLEGYIIFFDGCYDVYLVNPRFSYFAKIGTAETEMQAMELWKHHCEEPCPEVHRSPI
jgi:hypothetical protein